MAVRKCELSVVVTGCNIDGILEMQVACLFLLLQGKGYLQSSSRKNS
jgi:hypothetical protein